MRKLPGLGAAARTGESALECCTRILSDVAALHCSAGWGASVFRRHHPGPHEVLEMVATKAEVEQLQERIRELLEAEGIKSGPGLANDGAP